MTRLVQLVADYGPGDLAFAELIQRLALAVPEAAVHLTRVAPSDTVAAGFCAAQLALTEGPPERVVAHDVAADRAPDPRLCAGRTRDGVWIVGANAGWSWSFVVDELTSLCHLDVSVGGSGLALALTHVVKRHPHAFYEQVPRETIPQVPEQVVAYVDNAGNVTTTIAEPPAPAGTRIRVLIGSVTEQALVTDSRPVPHGELALSAGSGWPSRRGGRRCYQELVLGGGSAAERFEGATPGTSVRLSV